MTNEDKTFIADLIIFVAILLAFIFGIFGVLCISLVYPIVTILFIASALVLVIGWAIYWKFIKNE